MKRIIAATCLFISLFSTCILAATEGEIYSGFDVQHANLQLEHISGQLKSKKVSYEELYNAVKVLDTFQEDAIHCIEKGKDQIQQIDELVNNREISSILVKEQDIRYQHLVNERTRYVKAMTECVLFNYRAQQLLHEIDDTMAKTRMSILLARSLPVWKEFNPQDFFRIHLNKRIVYQTSGIAYLSGVDLFITAFILIIGMILHFSLRSVSPIFKSHTYSTLYKTVMRSELLLVIALALANIYLHGVLPSIKPHPSILLFMNAILIYSLVISGLKFFLTLNTDNTFSLQSGLAGTIYLRTIIFATVLLWGYIASVLIRGQWVPPKLLDLRFIFLLTLISLSFGWLSWLVFKLPVFQAKLSSIWVRLIKVIIVGMFFFMIGMAWFGYSNFAIYFIPNIILSLMIFFMVWRISAHLGKIFSYLNDPGQPVSEKIHAWLGMKSTQKLTELYVIRIILNFGAILFSIFLLMKIWGVSQYHIDLLRNFYLSGGTVYGMYITPANIVRGAVLFCIFVMLGRGLSTYVARRSSFKKEKYRQHNIATLINYSVFGIALVIALLIAGVNFTNLTVIAGALSIGIGFGLQHIASDLVSGILILLHKPVMPGDRVQIDNNEGYIKKIRLLSTQIKTLNHADVIIPNSSLINKSVTNFTYRENRICRVNTEIILDSNSDLELARQVLLDTVSNQKKIIQDPPHQPKVHFELQPSQDHLYVKIDLWYFIDNVSSRQIVASEVNYNIVKALKENNLCPGQQPSIDNS